MANTEKDDTNSTASAFAAFLRIAKPGQIVCFRSTVSVNSSERSGIVFELHPDGIVIDADSGIEWIPAQDIQVWRVLKQAPTKSHSPEEKPTITSAMTSDIPSISSTIEKSSPPPEVSQKQILPSSTLPLPADLELFFTGDPLLQLPAPSFSFQSLPKDVQQEINRWKNRYDYAQKVHEPARMSQDVARIAELAENIDNAELYFIAGFLADYSGLGSSRAKTYFQNALGLSQTHQEAAIAAAALAIKENDWAEAVKFLLWAVRLEGNADKTTLVRCIGQCVLRMNNKNIPPIGSLFSSELPEAGRRLVINLVALLVKEDITAYRTALQGSVQELRMTKIGNDLFPWKDEIVAPVELKITRHAVTPNSSHDKARHGRVSAYYPGRNFGFIVEDATGQTWFFHKNAITSPSLLIELNEGEVRQNITFSGSVDAKSGKYPLAEAIALFSQETAIQEASSKRAPLSLRLQAIPKNGSYFAKAMEAEQLDQLDRAEGFYHEEIIRRGRHEKSAVKNLAALKNRKGKPEAAIELLDKYQNVFDATEYVSLDQMRVQFLVKAKNFNVAARLLSKLAKNNTVKNKRIEYQRQQAYCLLASGEFDDAITLLNSILKVYPWDNASTLLLAKARDAKETGQIPFDPETGSDSIEDDILSSLSLGLSPIARQQLDSCELRGIDARTRESGNFTDQDVRQVQALLDNVKGRRPRERSDYLLTLAWLCDHASSVTGNRSVHEYLRRYFLALAEATLSDGSPRDVGRCYCIESLTLCPTHLEPGREAQTSFEAAWALLLGTYLSNSVEPSELLQPTTGKRLPKVLQMLNEQPEGWRAFRQDANFYSHRAPAAFEHLQSMLKSHQEISIINDHSTLETDRVKKLDNAFALLPKDSLSVDKYRQAREALSQINPLLHFELDRSRLLEFLKILTYAADYVLERNFRERETRYLRLTGDISRAIQDLHRHPTHMSLERMAPALSSLRELVKSDFEHVEIAHPVLELRNVLDSDFYVISDGSVALRLLLVSKDESAPPIEAIGLVIEEGDGEPCHSPEPLHGGQTREIEFIVRPTARQIRDGAFSVRVKVDYRNRKGNTESSPAFPLAVRLGKPAFDEIPNPYGRYSGGSPVLISKLFEYEFPI